MSLVMHAYLPAQKVGTRDRVVNHHAAVNGGCYINYNLGDSLVHGVGHWLGPLHSKKTKHQTFPSHSSHLTPFSIFFLAFKGGCSGGALVSDTAAEERPA